MNKMKSEYHTPVLLKECIEGLQIKADGIYVDATFGGGGHSCEILKQISKGKLFAFDQDADAVPDKADDERFIFLNRNFINTQKALEERGIKKIDGLLADLGVSSHQFDVAERGFSTRFDADLDMRMSRSSATTAADILNTYDQRELKMILKSYGEILRAHHLSEKIVSERKKKPFETIAELKTILKEFAPGGKENKFYAQVFQALRIEVNDELNALKNLLKQCVDLIKKGGRLVILSYHSLEDRLVKNFIRSGRFEGDADKDLFGNILKPFKNVNKKPIVPSQEEIKKNPRAASAKLRIAERL